MLIKKVFHLTHEINIEETKVVLRKPGRLSFSLYILWDCVIQNIPLKGHRDSVKNDAELAQHDYNIIAYTGADLEGVT